MPVFRYSAKDIQGVDHKGEVEAADKNQAATLLMRKRLIVISIKPKDQIANKYLEKVFSRVSFDEIVIMTRQLATMIESGLILSEALDILEEQQANLKFKKTLATISRDVKGGIDFATAIEKHSDVFPSLYSKLVKAGQTSGKLDIVLLQLADNLEKEREFRSKVQGAMIYPIVVITMMLAVMLIMVFFVMPKLMDLYKDSNIELPLPTKIMIGFADFMIGFWWLILAIVIGVGIAFHRYISSPDGRLKFDSLILKLPVLGKIVSLVALTSFTRTFSLLVASGISILESIKIIGDISENQVYKNGFAMSYKGVERGLTFSSQLLSLPFFPRIVGQMIKTGEETGKLDTVIARLADYFQAETDNSLKNITTLIEPIVLVLLGIGVAFLVISIILPIYQLTTNIS